MRDYLSLGSVPLDEPCAQIGDDDYHSKSIKECNEFIKLIREELGTEPPGAQLKVKGFPHDFGTYYEVVCYFEDSIEEAVDYAFRCESNTPLKWKT